jgi:hypothetical protein
MQKPLQLEPPRCQGGKQCVLPLGHTTPVGGDCHVPYQIHTATAMSFSHGSDLMFLRDSYKLNFLVDSGASLSIIPFSSSLMPFGPKLLGANGTSIPTWGFQTKTSIIGTNTFEHEFLLAKVAVPILGLDFFMKFQLSIHPLQCQELDKAGNPISAIFAVATAAANQNPQQEVRSLPSSDAAAAMASAAPTREVRHPSAQPPTTWPHQHRCRR